MLRKRQREELGERERRVQKDENALHAAKVNFQHGEQRLKEQLRNQQRAAAESVLSAVEYNEREQGKELALEQWRQRDRELYARNAVWRHPADGRYYVTEPDGVSGFDNADAASQYVLRRGIR